MTAESDRKTPTYVATIRFSDFEHEMAKIHGQRFVTYREAYYRNLEYDKTGFIPDFPLTLQVEFINRCNLSCRMCWTANHKTPKSVLSIETLRKMLAEGKEYGLPAFVMGMGAEALLYKPVKEVMDSAIENGVMDIFFASNGVLMDEDICRYLVDNQVSRCWVSLDAATPETFLKIRGKDELPKIEANLRRLVELKRERGSSLPNIRVSFCVQDENFHEIEAFIEKWQDWVDHIDFQREIDFKYIDELVATGTVKEMPKAPEDVDLAHPRCHYPFGSLNVWANGDVTPCCTFYGRHLVVGNANEQSLKEIWDGEKVAAIRKEFETGQINPTCQVCLSSRLDAASFEAVKKTAESAETEYSATQ